MPPVNPRKREWNAAARRAARRLRVMYPDAYADLLADEAAKAGLIHTRKPRRRPITPLPDLSATETQEESP